MALVRAECACRLRADARLDVRSSQNWPLYKKRDALGAAAHLPDRCAGSWQASSRRPALVSLVVGAGNACALYFLYVPLVVLWLFAVFAVFSRFRARFGVAGEFGHSIRLVSPDLVSGLECQGSQIVGVVLFS